MNQVQAIHPFFILNIVNPTLNFKDIHGIQPWLDSTTSYFLIPAIPSNALLNPWQIVEKLLPFSKNTLIDISLPYQHPKQEGTGTIRHTARYFILNQKLLCIRVKISEGWKKYRCQKIRLPQSLIRSYQNKLNINEQQCMVGHFYLTFKHFKLAPIFQSQIDASLQMVTEYERFGCEVYSITDDVLKKAIGQVSQIQPLLFSKSETLKNIYIYTGIKTSLHPTSCYWTNAFLLYGSELKRCSANAFSDGGRIKVPINFLICRRNKIFTDIKFLQGKQYFITGLNFRNQTIKFDIKPPKTDYCLNLPNEKPTNQNILMLYIWYLFNIVNSRNPFVVGVPFTEKIACLIHTIKEIKEFFQQKSLKFPSEILIIYKVTKKSQEIQSEHFWPDSLQDLCESSDLYQNLQDLCERRKNSELFCYTDSKQDIKQLLEISQYLTNIKICANLLPDQFLVKKVDQAFLRTKIVVNDQKKSLEKLSEEVLAKGFQTLDRMVRYFMKRNNNLEDLAKAFTQIIPKRLKTNVSLTPHYFFLMTASKDEINQALEEIELAIKQSKNSSVVIQVDKSISQVNEHKPDVAVKLKKIHAFKQNNSKNFAFCHICLQVLKVQTVVKCLKCQNSFCYECLRKAGQIPDKHVPSEDIDKNFEQNCPACKKTCRCLHCSEKLKSIPQEKKQIKKMPNYAINSCFNCQLAGVPDRLAIELECSKCSKLGCVACLKAQKKISDNYFYDEFTCELCLNSLIPNIESKVPVNRTTFLNEYETVQGIKKRAELEEKQRQLNVKEQMLRNQERHRKERSLERSRKKKREQRNHSESGSISSSSSSSSSSKRSFSEDSKKQKGEEKKRRSQSKDKYQRKQWQRRDDNQRDGRKKQWKGKRGQFRGRGNHNNQGTWRNKTNYKNESRDSRNRHFNENKYEAEKNENPNSNNQEEGLWNCEQADNENQNEPRLSQNFILNTSRQGVEEEYEY